MNRGNDIFIMTLYLTEAVPQLFSVYNCDFWLASDVTNHT